MDFTKLFHDKTAFEREYLQKRILWAIVDKDNSDEIQGKLLELLDK